MIINLKPKQKTPKAHWAVIDGSVSEKSWKTIDGEGKEWIKQQKTRTKMYAKRKPQNQYIENKTIMIHMCDMGSCDWQQLIKGCYLLLWTCHSFVPYDISWTYWHSFFFYFISADREKCIWHQKHKITCNKWCRIKRRCSNM